MTTTHTTRERIRWQHMDREVVAARRCWCCIDFLRLQTHGRLCVSVSGLHCLHCPAFRWLLLPESWESRPALQSGDVRTEWEQHFILLQDGEGSLCTTSSLSSPAIQSEHRSAKLEKYHNKPCVCSLFREHWLHIKSKKQRGDSTEGAVNDMCSDKWEGRRTAESDTFLYLFSFFGCPPRSAL